MSRVIKFRAWDGENMSYSDDYAHLEHFFACNESPPEGVPELMQFTGLHDKDGKEIYEGDILASDECIIGSVSYCTDPFCFYAAQFYITDGFGFAADESTLEDCDKHLSVVGNIHEAPELLES